MFARRDDWLVYLGGSSPDATVTLSGQQITASLGTLSAQAESNKTLSGIAMTMAQGSLTVTITKDATVSLTGLAMSMSQGALSVTGDANKSLSGIAMTLSQGTIAAQALSNVTLSGLAASLAQGTLSVQGEASKTLSGLQIASQQGSITPAADSNISLQGQQITSAQGAVTVEASGEVSVDVNLSGMQMQLMQGQLSMSGNTIAVLTAGPSDGDDDKKRRLTPDEKYREWQRKKKKRGQKTQKIDHVEETRSEIEQIAPTTPAPAAIKQSPVYLTDSLDAITLQRLANLDLLRLRDMAITEQLREQAIRGMQIEGIVATLQRAIDAERQAYAEEMRLQDDEDAFLCTMTW